jgi:hypothetical protein
MSLAGSTTVPPPKFEAKQSSSSPEHDQQRGSMCRSPRQHQNMRIASPAQVCRSYSSVIAASMPLSAFATSACMLCTCSSQLQLHRPKNQHRPSDQCLHRHHQQLRHGLGPARCPNMPALNTCASGLHHPNITKPVASKVAAAAANQRQRATACA